MTGSDSVSLVPHKMKQVDQLVHLVAQLFEQLNNRAPGSGDIEDIKRVITETRLNSDQNIPEWIILFFDGIVNRKNVSGSMGPDTGNLSSICSMVSKLSHFLGAELEDAGEFMSLLFEKLDVEAVIFLQGKTYEISA